MNKIISEIYTDGACSGNPGPGGWGVVVYHLDKSVEEFGGSNPSTTNNIQELTAVIEAFKYIKANHQTETITIYSDSSYVVKGVNEWMPNWYKKGWKKSDKKPILNLELWKEIYSLLHLETVWGCNIHLKLVKGHSGIEGNERADKIATSYIIK